MKRLTSLVVNKPIFNGAANRLGVLFNLYYFVVNMKYNKSTQNPRGHDRDLSYSSPMHYLKKEILQKLDKNDTLIIIGETACGKTTMIPKMLYDLKINKFGIIGCTQPRRIAAISIAQFVANSIQTELGQLVGYAVRFDDTTSYKTRIKYMTDGILLKEATQDPLLLKYSVIILDEAHERSLNTDLLLSIVKRAKLIRNSNASHETNQQPPHYPHLIVIIMSATMDVVKFSRFFNNCPVICIEGRTYSITTLYTQQHMIEQEYIYNALVTVFQIHCQDDPYDSQNGHHNGIEDEPRSHDHHDILVFMPGREEIEAFVTEARKVCRSLEIDRPHLASLTFHPLYSGLPSSTQLRTLRPNASQNPDPTDQSQKGRNVMQIRKVIVATNIAETSITIPGIRYVVDTGRFKMKSLQTSNSIDPSATHMLQSKVLPNCCHHETLNTCWISKAQAWQRTGRAGRECPGYCYRLYTESQFEQLPEYPMAEITRCDLTTVMAQIVAILDGFTATKDVPFEFFESPPLLHIHLAVQNLYDLDVVDDKNSGLNKGLSDQGNPPPTLQTILNSLSLTPTGLLLNNFPLDPSLAKMLVQSSKTTTPAHDIGNNGLLQTARDCDDYQACNDSCCSEEICTIVAMLSSLGSCGGTGSLFTSHNKNSPGYGNNSSSNHNNESNRNLGNVHAKFYNAESDHITLLNIMRAFKSNKGDSKWCTLNQLNRKSLLAAYKINKQLRKICKLVDIPLISCGNELWKIRKALAQGFKANTAELQNHTNSYKASNFKDQVYIHPSSGLFSLKPKIVVYSELLVTIKPYMRIITAIQPEWQQEISNIRTIK